MSKPYYNPRGTGVSGWIGYIFGLLLGIGLVVAAIMLIAHIPFMIFLPLLVFCAL